MPCMVHFQFGLRYFVLKLNFFFSRIRQGIPENSNVSNVFGKDKFHQNDTVRKTRMKFGPLAGN